MNIKKLLFSIAAISLIFSNLALFSARRRRKPKKRAVPVRRKKVVRRVRKKTTPVVVRRRKKKTVPVRGRRKVIRKRPSAQKGSPTRIIQEAIVGAEEDIRLQALHEMGYELDQIIKAVEKLPERARHKARQLKRDIREYKEIIQEEEEEKQQRRTARRRRRVVPRGRVPRGRKKVVRRRRQAQEVTPTPTRIIQEAIVQTEEITLEALIEMGFALDQIIKAVNKLQQTEYETPRRLIREIKEEKETIRSLQEAIVQGRGLQNLLGLGYKLPQIEMAIELLSERAKLKFKGRLIRQIQQHKREMIQREEGEEEVEEEGEEERRREIAYKETWEQREKRQRIIEYQVQRIRGEERETWNRIKRRFERYFSKLAEEEEPGGQEYENIKQEIMDLAEGNEELAEVLRGQMFRPLQEKRRIKRYERERKRLQQQQEERQREQPKQQEEEEEEERHEEELFARAEEIKREKSENWEHIHQLYLEHFKKYSKALRDLEGPGNEEYDNIKQEIMRLVEYDEKLAKVIDLQILSMIHKKYQHEWSALRELVKGGIHRSHEQLVESLYITVLIHNEKTFVKTNIRNKIDLEKILEIVFLTPNFTF